MFAINLLAEPPSPETNSFNSSALYELVKESQVVLHIKVTNIIGETDYDGTSELFVDAEVLEVLVGDFNKKKLHFFCKLHGNPRTGAGPLDDFDKKEFVVFLKDKWEPDPFGQIETSKPDWALVDPWFGISLYNPKFKVAIKSCAHRLKKREATGAGPNQ